MAESGDRPLMKLHIKTSKDRETIEVTEDSSVDEVSFKFYKALICYRHLSSILVLYNIVYF